MGENWCKAGWRIGRWGAGNDRIVPRRGALAVSHIHHNILENLACPCGIVVQPMIEGGIELIIALRNDPTFGPVIVAGLGGTLVEILKQASVRLAPVDHEPGWP